MSDMSEPNVFGYDDRKALCGRVGETPQETVCENCRGAGYFPGFNQWEDPTKCPQCRGTGKIAGSRNPAMKHGYDPWCHCAACAAEPADPPTATPEQGCEACEQGFCDPLYHTEGKKPSPSPQSLADVPRYGLARDEFDADVFVQWPTGDYVKLADLAPLVQRLEKENAEAKALVTEANNSLYGSQGYFHSLNGGPFDKYHLANGIENLKSESNRAVNQLKAERDAAIARAEQAEASLATLREEVARHLSPENENVKRGDVRACIRDLAQIAVAGKDNSRTAIERLEAAEASLLTLREKISRIYTRIVAGGGFLASALAEETCGECYKALNNLGDEKRCLYHEAKAELDVLLTEGT